MPKIKTNRGAAKRFRKTGSGGFKTGHAYVRHILTSKSTKRKRRCGVLPLYMNPTSPVSGACCRTVEGDEPCRELNVVSPPMPVTRRY